MFARLITWGACAVLLLGLVSGCGKGKLAKVNGVLTWEDGTPVDGATIVFMPKDSSLKQASGFTGKDGAFDLTTFKPGDGAMEGDYKIVVTRAADAVTNMPPAPLPGEDPTKAMKEYYLKQKAEGSRPPSKVVPDAYTKESTTPLIATVSSSTGKIELKLKKI
jgi:hypothetical protein